VFTKGDFHPSPLSVINTKLITEAYKRPNRMLNLNLSGGVHALSRKHTIELIGLIGVQPDDTCWELGCGEMNLAFALSAASLGGLVIATDLPSVLLQLVQIYEEYKRATRKRKLNLDI
jgi:ubiquinone/menaquinone biosynthesis C-methylase UbiE